MSTPTNPYAAAGTRPRRSRRSPVSPATMSRSCSARAGATPRPQLGRVVWEGPLTDVPGRSRSRPSAGTRAGCSRSTRAARAVLVFAGRSHLYEGHPVAHGRARRAHRGARPAAASSSSRTRPAASIPTSPVGTPVLLRDHLNLTGASPMVGDDPPAPLRDPVLRPHRGVRRRPPRARAPRRPGPARRRLRRACSAARTRRRPRSACCARSAPISSACRPCSRRSRRATSARACSASAW